MATLVKLTADMQRVLNEQRLGFVASVCEDGTPNLSPKGTTTVWDDEHIVFADICSPGTIANIRHHPIVEINVVDPVSRKGRCHSNKKKLLRRVTAMKWTDKIFPGFVVVRKDKRDILSLLDEK